MGVAVGIDLGTTNTVVAAVKNGVATTLADSEGHKLIPSVVAFHPNGTVQVGHAALERRIIDPENTVYSVKRLIGRSFQSAEVQAQMKRFPFQLVEGPKGATLVSTRKDTYALPEISAFVLRRAKAVAEAALGEPVDAAVITVPANFDDPQRASTKMAGKLAGLEVLRILNEPTAAALAYGRSPEKSERICVYDLGGGTFDVTLLDVAKGVFEVLSTAGDTALGGDDVDALIVDRMTDQTIRQLRVDPRGNPPALARMRVAAEALKKTLSSKSEGAVEVLDIGRAEEGVPLTLKFAMTRAELERVAQPLFERTLEVTRKATAAANIDVGGFDRVILVGGATRMPAVVRAVEAHFKRRADQRINPDEVVALGAAIQAYALGARRGRGAKRAPADAPPPPLRGKETDPPPTPRVSVPLMPPEMAHAVTETEPKPAAKPGEVPPIHTRPTRPTMRRVGEVKEIRSTRFDPRAEPEDSEPPPTPQRPASGPELPPTKPTMNAVRDRVADEPLMTLPGRTSRIDWNEADLPPPSALPGTPRASGPPPVPSRKPPPVVELSSAELKPDELDPSESLLIDVTPLSLRVETVGGYSDVLIAANSSVPCDRTRVFSTASDAQTHVFIRVAQGESPAFQQNTFLGELELAGIEPLARGEAQIAVTFEIDADGILAVRAKDQRTGKETAARMHVFGAQTDQGDLEKMMQRQRQRALA